MGDTTSMAIISPRVISMAVDFTAVAGTGRREEEMTVTNTASCSTNDKALAVFPGWFPNPGLYLVGTGISFGLGFGVGLFAGYSWGWNDWGCDWHHGAVVYNHQTFTSHSRAIGEGRR